AGADPNARLRSHPWYMVYSGCGNRNCGLADNSGSTPFWRAAYATDVDAMKLLVAYGADPSIPTIAPQQSIRRGAQGAPGGRGGAPGGAPGGGRGGRGGPAPTGPGSAASLAYSGAGGPVKPEPDANQERFTAPPVPGGGPGAYAIHAAAGLEYGEGFAGNAHRHAPD